MADAVMRQNRTVMICPCRSGRRESSSFTDCVKTFQKDTMWQLASRNPGCEADRVESLRKVGLKRRDEVKHGPGESRRPAGQGVQGPPAD